MKSVFHDISQNTEEWLELRLGLYTASTFKDVFMGEETAGYEKSIYKPVYERLTGESPEFYSSKYMERGHEVEPLAVDFYEKEYMTETTNGGFFTLGDWIGASPDRLIDDDGILEVKSPAFNTQINYILKGQLPNQYYWQVQGQLYVTGREYCDFIAYHPKLDSLVIRIERDEEEITKLADKLQESISKSKLLLSKLKG